MPHYYSMFDKNYINSMLNNEHYEHSNDIINKLEELMKNQNNDDSHLQDSFSNEQDEQKEIVIPSERIYHEQGYDEGDYCHEQSFLWGFQEGCDYAVQEFLEMLKNNWRNYISKDKDGMVRFSGWEEDFKLYMIKKQMGEI